MATGNDYGTYGSVPTTEATGQEGSGIGVRANGDDFGAQVGQANQNLGATEQKVGDQEFDQAMAQQKIVNETTMTNADIDYSKNAGAIRAKYMSLTGLAATQAFPQYQNDLEQARLQSREGLNPAAARGYDLLSTRTTANHIIDGSGYAASQLKAAQRDSGSSLMDIKVDDAGNPLVANNPERFHQTLGDIHYAASLQAGDATPGSGVKQDPDTGELSFDDTPAGKAAQATHDQTIQHATALAWQNRYTTLAAQDPIAAQKQFNDEKDSIPPAARVNIEASLSPQVQDKHAQNVTGATINQANADHEKVLLNPTAYSGTDAVKTDTAAASSTGSNSYNIGNVKTAAAAAGNTAGFVAPATPADGVTLAANTLRKGYEGLNLLQIGAKWAPPSENQTSNWVQNVSKASGFDPGDVPNLNDPAQLARLVKGIGVAEKSPKDLKNFSDDVINQGVSASLSGKQAATSQAASAAPQEQPAKPYATNPDGSPLTRADYYAANKDKILTAGDDYANKTMPGDLEFKNMVRSRLENQISTAISSQSAQYKQDNAQIQKGIVGSLTKGNPPTTYEELRAIPGMADVIDRSAVHSPEYFKSIDTQIAKMSKQNVTTNSANGYDTIMRTLEPHGSQNPNAISSQDHLDKLLGRNDGTGINKKDYMDAKPLIEADQTFKDALSTQMKAITNANGNVDGKGQDRAMLYYQQVMAAKAANDKLGDKALPDAQFVASLGTKEGPPMPAPPSRMQQIHNWANKMNQSPLQGTTQPGFGKDHDIPVLSDKSQFDALDPGAYYMRNGQKYQKPKA